MSEAERLRTAWIIEGPLVDMPRFVRMDDFSWESRSDVCVRRVLIAEDSSVSLETEVGGDVVRSPWEVDESSAEALWLSLSNAIDVHCVMIDRHIAERSGRPVWSS